jgi:hypothetical protein
LFVHGERSPEVHVAQRLQTFELCRHAADDRELDAVENHRSADDVRIRGEGSLPEACADDHHRRRAKPHVFFGRNRSSESSVHTEHLEVVAGDQLPAYGDRLGSTDQVGANEIVGGQAGKLGNVVAKVPIVG